MLLTSWLGFQRGASRRTPPGRRPARRRLRPTLERLEGLTLLANYTAATVSDLIADINAANQGGGANTITLTAPTTSPYVLTGSVNNNTDGGNSLPVIAANDNLTIVGNGDTIEGGLDTYGSQYEARPFDVAIGASLALQNLTLQDFWSSCTFPEKSAHATCRMRR